MRTILRGMHLPTCLVVAVTACASPSGTDAPPLMISHAAVSGDGQAGRAGQLLPDSLRVLVTRGGQPVSGVPITWSTPHGAIAGSTVTDARGVAAAAWRLPAATASGVRAVARLPSWHSGAAVEFTAAASFPTIALLAGGGQRGDVATTLPVPIRLRVTWQGRPIVGDTIVWTGDSDVPPVMEPVAAVTDSAGEVRVTWTLGPLAGAQLASARLASDGETGPGLGLVAVADAGAPASLQWRGRMSLPVGRTWVRGYASWFDLEARVTDEFGNALAGVPLTFRLRGEGGDVFREAHATSASEGVARSAVEIASPDAMRPFRIEASAVGVPDLITPVQLLDLLFVHGPIGDELLPGNQVTVPVGATVRWGSIAADHECRREDGSGEVGLVGAGLSRVLEVRQDQPGSYLWACSGSGYTDAWLVWIHVAP